MTLLAWFLSTKLGRALVAGFAIAAAIGVALLTAFSRGKAAQKAQEDAQSLENLREREKTDDEIGKLSDADARGRLGRWVPDK